MVKDLLEDKTLCVPTLKRKSSLQQEEGKEQSFELCSFKRMNSFKVSQKQSKATNSKDTRERGKAERKPVTQKSEDLRSKKKKEKEQPKMVQPNLNEIAFLFSQSKVDFWVQNEENQYCFDGHSLWKAEEPRRTRKQLSAST